MVCYKDPLYLCIYNIVTKRYLFLFKFVPWFSVICLPKAIQDSNKRPLFNLGSLYPCDGGDITVSMAIAKC